MLKNLKYIFFAISFLLCLCLTNLYCTYILHYPAPELPSPVRVYFVRISTILHYYVNEFHCESEQLKRFEKDGHDSHKCF